MSRHDIADTLQNKWW